jgi:hypothetical protein
MNIATANYGYSSWYDSLLATAPGYHCSRQSRRKLDLYLRTLEKCGLNGSLSRCSTFPGRLQTPGGECAFQEKSSQSQMGPRAAGEMRPAGWTECYLVNLVKGSGIGKAPPPSLNHHHYRQQQANYACDFMRSYNSPDNPNGLRAVLRLEPTTVIPDIRV